LGRPVKFDRDEAVEMAMQTFRKRGYGGTSVSDLATAMNITRSSFYNSFGSRAELFEETLLLYLNPEHGAALHSAMETGHVGEGLHQFFRHICNILETAPDNCGCLIMNSLVAASSHDDAPEGVRRFMATKKTQFTALIERAVNRGEIQSVDDIDALAESMLAFLIGLNMLGRGKKSDGYLYNVAKSYLRSMGFTETP
jgi:TetR/AcrR family transcriptional repressor of nem operon